jgi:hypothetical protein
MRFGPDAPECLEAVNLGKHYIQNGQSVVSRKRFANSLGAVGCDIDVKSFRFQIFTQEIAQLDIIVYDQDIRRRCGVRLDRVMRPLSPSVAKQAGVIMTESNKNGPAQRARLGIETNL